MLSAPRDRIEGAPAWAVRGCAVVAITVTYWFLQPGNHTEADDTFDYAARIVGGLSSHELLARQVVFLPLGKAVLYLSDRLGLGFDALQSLQFVSALATAIGLVIFHGYLRRGAMLGTASALAGTVVLGASHGVWRYSMEADAYGLALLGGAAVLYGDAAWRDGRWSGRAFYLLGPMVMSFNLFLAIPFAVLPAVRMIGGRDLWGAIRHGLTSVAVGVGTMVFWFALVRPDGSMASWLGGGASRSSIGIDTPIRVVVGFGQTVISTTFAFGFPAVRNRLQTAFPQVNTSEEVFLGESMPGWVPYAGSVTAGVLFVVALRFLFLALVARRNVGASDIRTALGVLPAGERSPVPSLVPILAWMVAQGLLLVFANPTAPEPWIPLTVPLAAVLAVISARSSRATSAFGGLALVLVMHTLLGGWVPVRSVDTDYNVTRGRWLAQHVDDDDVTIVTYDSTYSRWLSYNYPWDVAEIGVLELRDVEALLEGLAPEDGERRVLLTDEVVHARSWGGGDEAARAVVDRHLEAWSDRVVVIAESRFGTLYELRPDAS